MSAKKEMVKRFFNEARAATSIHHPGIVEVFDMGFDDGRAFIVMEKLRGESLTSRLKKRRLTLSEAVTITRQLAGALGAAHERGIVHRDLKPDNLFLVPDPEVPGGERVKVLDFGIAKLGEDKSGSLMTAAGAVFGTPAYMAPEQCTSAANVDHRADLYAVGCILYELLSGQPPFGHGGIELLAAHLRDRPPPLRARAPEVPEQLEAVVERLLAKQRQDRYPSSRELIAALDAGFAPSLSPRTAGPDARTMTPVQGLPTQLAASLTGPGPHGTAALPGPGGATGLPGPHGTAALPAGDTSGPRGTVPLSAAGSGGWPPADGPRTQPLTTHSAAAGEARASSTAPDRERPRRWLVPAAVLAACGAAGAVFAVLRVRGADDQSPTAQATAPAPAPEPPPTPEPAVPPPPPDAAPPPSLNAWVPIAPVSPPPILGVGDGAHRSARGFRPAREIRAPAAPYEIHAHEVTWRELETWLADNPDHEFPAPAWADGPAAARADLPATGVPWPTALAYCQSVGGTLPSEEQWEFAARGPDLAPNPWGAGRLDPMRTHAYRGPGAQVVKVMTRDQDVTPRERGPRIYDLLGNAREWTADLWREDHPGKNEAWTAEGDQTYRAVRGLPLAEKMPAAVQEPAAAYREPLCATGPCVAKSGPYLKYVGFRCVRTP
jgi:serine/threonine-protein kinase